MVKRGGRKARKQQRLSPNKVQGVWPGVVGGRYRPLDNQETRAMDESVMALLETLGLSNPTPEMVHQVTGNGGLMHTDRLLFPRDLVRSMIETVRKPLVLYGRNDALPLTIDGNRVHTGTGGGAPLIADAKTREFRPATSLDLYESACVVDKLEHIHLFSRPLVCTDAEDTLSLDINTLYACLSGTRKHVCMSVSDPVNMKHIAACCYQVAGSEQAFRQHPFVTIMATHVVPPMRFSRETCETVAEAIRHGFPVQLISAGQMGATSPVTLAGSLTQALAESLAGMVFGWLVDPQAQLIFAPKPLVSDLRTGAMCGGGGEQAVVMAAAAQMGRFYDLPNSSIAGYSDAKMHDSQAGYEKNLSVTLAAQAGCNIITHSCGSLASMLGYSHDALVIDNDMLGGVLRSIRGVEVTDDTLSNEVIHQVVAGEGHYLGHQQTLQRMQSDYVYPVIADRQTPAAWQEQGNRTMRSRAIEWVDDLLKTHRPCYIPDNADQWIRDRYSIMIDPGPEAA